MSCHGTPFEGYMAWNYLDLGEIGIDKELAGVDLVINGTVQLAIGFNQKDSSQATAPFTVDGDTLPGIGMIPFPLTAPSFQVRLTFVDEPWEWFASNIYKLGEAGT
jgi:hypothetical protein